MADAQWLTTEVDSTTTHGTSTARTIVMSGTDTSSRAVPIITRTTTTNEDEGLIISFAVPIIGGLGTVPAGD